MPTRRSRSHRITRLYYAISPRIIHLVVEKVVSKKRLGEIREHVLGKSIVEREGRIRSTPEGHVWALIYNGTSKSWSELSDAQKERHLHHVLQFIGKNDVLVSLRRIQNLMGTNEIDELGRTSRRSEQYETLVERIRRKQNAHSIIEGIIRKVQEKQK
ncbi:MAG: hypothetical protein V1776_03740 [Candidatus Diapherotrites archaeon]